MLKSATHYNMLVCNIDKYLYIHILCHTWQSSYLNIQSQLKMPMLTLIKFFWEAKICKISSGEAEVCVEAEFYLGLLTSWVHINRRHWDHVREKPEFVGHEVFENHAYEVAGLRNTGFHHFFFICIFFNSNDCKIIKYS